MIEDSMSKTCKLYLPVVRTLGMTKLIDFNQADNTWYCVCLFIFLAVHFDWSIILIRKSFGASQHISGKLGVKLAILQTRNQTLTLPFFSNILVSLPGAGFWRSVYDSIGIIIQNNLQKRHQTLPEFWFSPNC